MFYKFCYVFIGFGFLFIYIRIFANKKFERFAIEHDFSSFGDTYVILAIISLAASFAFFYLALRSTKNIKKCPSNATFYFITQKSKKRNRKIKNLLKVKNVKLKDKSKMLVDFELIDKVWSKSIFQFTK